MPKSHNDKHDLNHFLRVESYVKWIENLYKALIKKISGLSLSINTSNDKPFSFDDYPLLKKQVDELFFKFAKSITIQLQENNVKEWKYAEDRMADIVRSVAKKTKLPKAVISEYQRHNLNALNAFQNRKTDGLKLSDRVWKYTNQFRNEIEMGLDLGIGEGKSAAQMASELKSYLQDPDKLFRRVRDKHGTLHLSKNAENYHPGQGVYRSSYKNAARLTRTENNIAYHEAMFEKYNQFDFVIGIEIRLSNNPNHCPFCAEMAGKYPKDFKFWGWHPHCRCTTIPILKSWEQMNEDNEMLVLAKLITDSPERILQPKTNFMNWVKANKEKIERAKVKPFFIQNNEKIFTDIINGNYDKRKFIDNNLARYSNTTNSPNGGLLFMDITGGGITTAIKLYNKHKGNRDRINILKEIVNMREFQILKSISTKDNKVFGFNVSQYDDVLKQKEMPKNIAIAQKLVQNKYDVYLLPNISGMKSADFITIKDGKLFYFEAKTINGKSTIKQRLLEASTQSDRVVLDIIGVSNPNDIAENVKWFFEKNDDVKEILMFKKSRPIYVSRRKFDSKNFVKKFIKEWEQKK